MSIVIAPDCRSCGAPNAGTRFCESCGQPADAAIVQPTPTPAVLAEPVHPTPVASAPIPQASAQMPQYAYVPQYAYAPRTNTLAVLSLVFALLGGALLPIIFGHVAKSQIRRTGERGDGLATAGLIIGYLWLIVLVIILIATFASASRY